MAIEIITGFDQKEHELLDRVRGKVSNETARLAMKWVARGLLTFQIDTGETYQYIGNPPSNVAPDWALFTAIGPTGPPGLDGADGADGDKYATVSTDSFAIPETHPTTVNITIGLNLAYTAGQPIIVVADVTNSFSGVVLSYDAGLGNISIESSSHTGTGIFANWQVNLAGTQGTKGSALIHTEADIILDEAKIISVEGGVWTDIAPYSASVFNDARSNPTQPPQLNGSMTGHSISYDGTNWNDNGVWRGPTGIQGLIGSTGNTGLQGSIGNQGIQGVQGDAGIQGGIGPEGPVGAQGEAIKRYYFNQSSSFSLPAIGGDKNIQVNARITATSNDIVITLPVTNTSTLVAELIYKVELTGIVAVGRTLTIQATGPIYSSLSPTQNYQSGVFSIDLTPYLNRTSYSGVNPGNYLAFQIEAGPAGAWSITGGAPRENLPALVAEITIADPPSINVLASDGAIYTVANFVIGTRVVGSAWVFRNGSQLPVNRVAQASGFFNFINAALDVNSVLQAYNTSTHVASDTKVYLTVYL